MKGIAVMLLSLLTFMVILPSSAIAATIVTAAVAYLPYMTLPTGMLNSFLNFMESKFTLGIDSNSGTEAELLDKIKKQIADGVGSFKADIDVLKSKNAEYESLKTLCNELTLKAQKLAEKDGLKNSADFKTLADELNTAIIDIKALKSKGSKGNTVKEQIYDFIEKNHAKILEMKRSGTGSIELKAVGNMTTGSATNPDGIPDLVGVQLAPPTNVNLTIAIIQNLVTTFQTSLAAYAYTETLPKDGDFSFICECDIKPQIDFKIETRYAEPKKVAAYMALCEEAVTDIPGLQSIAFDFLRKKHDLKKQMGILFGTGVGCEPKGATLYARAFDPTGFNGVVCANFMDVINAAITDIYTTHNYTDEMPYQANLVLINPIDFFKQLVAAKDANCLPLFPQASLFNRVTIGGVTIIPMEQIPVGKIFVADMSKYNITDYVSYSVRIGWINDQFIHNAFTIVAESRFHAFVKKLDEQAFIYDDICAIKDAISLPGESCPA